MDRLRMPFAIPRSYGLGADDGFSLVEVIFLIGLIPIVMLFLFQSTRDVTSQTQLSRGKAAFSAEMSLLNRVLLDESACSRFLFDLAVTTDVATPNQVVIPAIIDVGTPAVPNVRSILSSPVGASVAGQPPFRVGGAFEYSSAVIIRGDPAGYANQYVVEIKAMALKEGVPVRPEMTRRFNIIGIQSADIPPRMRGCARPTSPAGDCFSLSGTDYCNREDIYRGGGITDAISTFWCINLAPAAICSWRTRTEGPGPNTHGYYLQ